jgi:putative ABC transport system permease protein
METLVQDVRFGLRMLIKQPGVTLFASFTLALGIGASSSIFSVINGVLLKPFPFAEPERLVVLWERSLSQGMPRMVVSPPNFADWRAQQSVFEDMAAYRQQDFNLLGGGDPERVRGLRVSATMFSMLGVQPELGRDFQPDEDQPGKPSVVIISHGFWQRRFGASSDVIGQPINLGSEKATIIGVMPREFDFPPPITFRGEARPVTVELWTQLRYGLELDQRGSHNLFVLARLKDGVSRERAEVALQEVTGRLATDFPDANRGWDAYVVPLHEQVVGDVKTALVLLPAAVAFVLLIACANVANLLLVRATGRQREMAIRTALGAGRFRLIRQILIESSLLSTFAGMLGLMLAAGGLKLITSLAPPNIYRLQHVSLDNSAVIFTLIISLLTALFFGSAPAWQASRVHLATALKDGSAGAGSGVRRHRVRNVLVVVEVALALLLLIGAGLLVRSFVTLQNVPTGFQAENLTAMTINLPSGSYPNRQARVAFAERLVTKLAALPMLQSVAFSDNLPLDTGRQGTNFKIEGQIVQPGQEPHTNVGTISPGYFQTMGIPLLAGRDFSAFDKADAPGVVIINSFLAERYFPGVDPVGKRLDMGFRSGTLLQIIGVVANERHDTLQADLHPGMYLPYAQAAKGLPVILLLRSESEPAALLSSVREQVSELDSQVPVYNVKSMNQVLYAALARPRFVTVLLTVFAGIAVLLAAAGIYGVMSHAVEQDTREIGIRMALGADTNQVLKRFIAQGVMLSSLGVVIGVAGALGLTRLMASLLFGVTTTDPLTFIGVIVLLVSVTLMACYVPARRASRVDPMVALRHE